jgi:hypothetical protein
MKDGSGIISMASDPNSKVLAVGNTTGFVIGFDVS